MVDPGRAGSRPYARRRSLPTFFEFVTAMAFSLFLPKNNVDLAILENRHGRAAWDATNVAQAPTWGIITNISIEHTEYLGRTPDRKSPMKKAGIIKPDQTVITGEKKRNRSSRFFEKNSPEKTGPGLLSLDADFSITPNSRGLFDYNGLEMNIEGLKSRLLGPVTR